MQSNQNSKTGSFAGLLTRGSANVGAVMQVKGPDGKDTPHWIRVRGVDSDEFQKATREGRTNLMDYIEKHGVGVRNTPEYLEFALVSHRRQQSALVMDWSFDEPCTPEKVFELFTEAPSVAEQVDTFAGDRGKFASVVQVS